MQQIAELDAQADRVDVRPARRRKASVRRKVTVRLSEGVCGRLDVATDRPGVGKSMYVEAALEQFMNPVPSVEVLLRERLDHMHTRFDHLEREMRMIAETVALHARYQLAVTPPVSQDRQQEAIRLGDERFKVLAEQVDRRVRERRPLMQETIDRLNSTAHEELESVTSWGSNLVAAPRDTNAAPGRVDFVQAPPASVKTERSSRSFVQYPKATADETKADRKPNLRVAHYSDLESSTAKLEAAREKRLPRWRLILSVFFPFAAGYYLAYLFRTINGSISPALASTFGLDAAASGLLASVYFLVFGFAQIPLGVLLDRFGPRRVQGVLLVIAAGGATLFGTASSFPELLAGRAMIGLGVAGSLMAGLKALVTWFPKERVALFNGLMIMLGSLGAVTATAPTERLLQIIGWRDLFEILTIVTVAVAGLVYTVVPDGATGLDMIAPDPKPPTLRSIFSDARFLRIAPLSAACIGSSWALHSLWASAWLADVEGLDHQSRASQMFLMAVGLSLGALLLGTMADRLRKRNISAGVLLVGVAVLFIVAELALLLRVPLPSLLPWSIVSIAGAATVLSFAAIAEYFPSGMAARANGALNLLHFGSAFAVQYGIGFIVEQWPALDGHYPTVAYQYGFGFSLIFQVAALTWFAIPWLGICGECFVRLFTRPTAEHDDRAGFIRVPDEGPVLDAQAQMEW
jgi:sugar phosphate permease